MGQLPNKNGFVDWTTVHKITKETLDKLELNINTKRRLKDLTVAQQEMVAIGKMVYQKAKVVVFDEPTALLTTEETEQLFEIIERLKTEGVGIIYISHRLEEIFEVCDTVTVLKDGELVGTSPVKEINEDRLISMMVGRDLQDIYSIKRHKTDEVVLKHEILRKNLDLET